MKPVMGGQGEHVDEVHPFIRTQKSLNLKNTTMFLKELGTNNNKGKVKELTHKKRQKFMKY